MQHYALNSNLVNLQNLEKEYNDKLLQEGTFYKQKSRIKWLCEGDKNTNFFHQMVARKRRNASITSLTLPNCSSSSKHKIIHSAAMDFFSNHLIVSLTHSSSSLFDLIPNLVSYKDNTLMLKLLLNSALGQDGFSSSFYTSC